MVITYHIWEIGWTGLSGINISTAALSWCLCCWKLEAVGKNLKLDSWPIGKKERTEKEEKERKKEREHDSIKIRKGKEWKKKENER